MINSFSQFLVEEEKAVYFTFGRMNPPTIGHGKLLDKLASKAGKNHIVCIFHRLLTQKRILYHMQIKLSLFGKCFQNMLDL